MSRKSAEERDMATGHEPERRRVAALMDARAEALTACSGTTFTVERGQMDGGVRHYILKAQRGGVAYMFQHKNMGLPRDQMEAFLTMLTDLCNIGLLPVNGARDERASVLDFLRRNYDAAAQDPGIPVNVADMINTVRICIELEEHL